MKNPILATILFMALVLYSCSREYKTVEATIIETIPPTLTNDNFVATIEYFVDSVRYTDEFEVPFWRMVEDSISVPAKGITFEILYDPKNPVKNKIQFDLKAKYKD